MSALPSDPPDDSGKAILFGSVTPLASLDATAGDMGAAFTRRGVPADVIWVAAHSLDRDRLLARLRSWARRPPRLVVAWNAKLHLRFEGVSVHDAFGIPLVAALIDHPAEHLKQLVQMPRRCLLGVIDRRHRAFLEQAPIALPPTFHLPHGGPPPIEEPKPLKDRPVDVLFCGNVGPPVDLGSALAEALARPREPALDRTAADLGERMMSETEDLWRVVCAELAARDVDARAPDIFPAACRLVEALSAHICRRWRVEVLNGLSGVRALIIGRLDPTIGIRLAPGIEAVGAMPFPAVRQAMAETKLVLNITPKYRDGSHERVFYAMAAGAAVMTDVCPWLAETLVPGRAVLFLPPDPKATGRQVGEVVADPIALQPVADAGRAAYAIHHTWDRRVDTILAAVDSSRPDHMPVMGLGSAAATP